jgi:Xaa-Pro dipeptidase
MRIAEAEYRERTAQLAQHARAEGLDGIVLFEPAYVLYYVGFAFVPTERPMAFALNADGEGGMLVPRLEREHAQANALVSHVSDYPEYPSETHPSEALRSLLGDLGLNGRVGADHDGYPWVFGYRGPSLSELMGAAPV